jgi:enediyne biosynthesis protein E3
VLSWVIVDGYGFHEGFFSRKRYVEQRAVPTHLSSYAQRLFDQGLGRSIWFSSGGNIDMVISTVRSFQQPRQIDIWSGVGLACAYGGGVERAKLEALREAVGAYRVQLARGAAVAAWGRKTAGNLVPHTDLACRVFGGVSAEEAADTADVASRNITATADQPAHEIWRQRTLAKFAVLD